MLKFMFHAAARTALLGLGCCLASVEGRASDPETIGLVAMRRERPAITGAGIRVAQPEGSEDPPTNTKWQVAPYAAPGVFFTWTSALGTATNYPNLVGTNSGHANSVATQFYYPGPVGVAIGVARVDSYEVGYFVTGVVAPKVATPAQVVNQSFYYAPDTFNTSYDAYAVQYNVLIVSGMNNAPAAPAGISTFANGIGVGFISSSAQSSIGPTADGRAKPDLVGVHTCCSSFSTPQVSGAAALLLQAGTANDGGPGTAALATNSSTIKALLLNGAVKTTNWTNGFTRPLDARYGAGVLNLYNSDWQLRGGRHAAIATNSLGLNAPHPPGAHTSNVASLRGWDFSLIQSPSNNDRVAHYYFLLPTNAAAYSATATLVWKKGSGALTNLELFLYATAGNTLVTCSTSSVDNVEHLFVPRLPAGGYDLQVLKRGASPSGTESYALAFDFSPATLALARSDTNVVVTWPASPAGFVLQSAPSLDTPIAWQSVAATDSFLSNAMNTVVMPASPTQKFFRLFRP